MIALVMALANAAVSAPTAAKLLYHGLRPMDYPSSAYYHNAMSRIRVVVAPDGSAERCDVLQPSGYDDVDKASCLSFTGNSRFVPARGAAKSPTYGVLFYNIYWHGARPGPGADADLTLYLGSAGGLKLPVTRSYAVLVDEHGSPMVCVPSGRLASSPLDDVACTYLRKSPSIAATDRAGAPHESVQEYSVRFELKPT